IERHGLTDTGGKGVNVLSAVEQDARAGRTLAVNGIAGSACAAVAGVCGDVARETDQVIGVAGHGRQLAYLPVVDHARHLLIGGINLDAATACDHFDSGCRRSANTKIKIKRESSTDRHLGSLGASPEARSRDAQIIQSWLPACDQG